MYEINIINMYIKIIIKIRYMYYMKNLKDVSIQDVRFEFEDYDHFLSVRKDKDSIKKETYFEYLREAVRELNKMSLDIRKGMSVGDLIRQHINDIRDHIARRSADISSDQFRKIRRAFVVTAIAHAGYFEANSFLSVPNPTPPENRKRKQGRNKRLTTVTPEVYEAVLDELSKDDVAKALILLAKTTGARPAEMNSIQFLGERLNEQGETIIELFIEGAKKTQKGKEGKWVQRGIDRKIHFKVTPIEKIRLMNAIDRASWMDEKEIKAAQERIRRATKRAFPRRKKKMFCLYSLRYTMGSNLKRAYKGVDDADKIIAAILGHKNTSSQGSYGYSQSGVVTKVPMVDADMIKKVRRDRKRRYGYGAKPGRALKK